MSPIINPQSRYLGFMHMHAGIGKFGSDNQTPYALLSRFQSLASHFYLANEKDRKNLTDDP